MIATSFCYGGVELWDNRVTQGFVDRFECEGNVCGVKLENCFCTTRLDPLTVDITTAPWYCVDDPASSEFMGMYLTMAEGYDVRPWERTAYDDSACPDGQCGSTLGTLRTKRRVMTFTVLGIGTTCAGAAYGKRWLQDTLQGGCGTGVGTCSTDVQVGDCCTLGIDGLPRSWSAHNAGVVGPVEFENICNCMVWKATFEISMQPYFFDCSGPSCNVLPGPCGAAGVCVPFDQWANGYDDLCNADCEPYARAIPFADSCNLILANQILGECGVDPRVTKCSANYDPDCLDGFGSDCNFAPPKPITTTKRCAPCISSNMSDWGACCPIVVNVDDFVFDIEISAGQWDVFGVHVAIFTECPTNDPLNCDNPVWDLMIPKMNAGSVYSVDGILCTETFNCTGVRSRGSKIGAVSRGATLLNCGTYYVAVRYACLDDLVQSPDFAVEIHPIARRASL